MGATRPRLPGRSRRRRWGSDRSRRGEPPQCPCAGLWRCPPPFHVVVVPRRPRFGWTTTSIFVRREACGASARSCSSRCFWRLGVRPLPRGSHDERRSDTRSRRPSPGPNRQPPSPRRFRRRRQPYRPRPPRTCPSCSCRRFRWPPRPRRGPGIARRPDITRRRFDGGPQPTGRSRGPPRSHPRRTTLRSPRRRRLLGQNQPPRRPPRPPAHSTI